MTKMSTATKPKPVLAGPMPGSDPSALGGLAPPPTDNLPAVAGQMEITTKGAETVTAIKVAVPRNIECVLQDLKVHCAAFGQTYLYSWEVWNSKEGRYDTIEGVTIKATNDLARIYGNCHMDIAEVVDTEDDWLFNAIFIDKETGASSGRPFLQSKHKNIGKGMKDQTRARDMKFQIGVSKALRNVVANALGSYAQFMLEESKKNFVGWVNQHRDTANDYVDRICKEHSIDVKRVEAGVGRLRKDWTDNDLAKVMMKLRGVDEGMASPADAFPSPDAADDVMGAKQADKAGKAAEAADTAKTVQGTGGKPETKKGAGKKTAAKTKAESETTEKPKPEETQAQPQEQGDLDSPKPKEPAPASDPEPATEAQEPAPDDGPDDDEGWGE